MKNKIQDEYKEANKLEVDFHHKVAYKFERAYRISKQQPQKLAELNLDIVAVISEDSDYI